MLIKQYFLYETTIAQHEVALRKHYSDSARSHKVIQKCFTDFKCCKTNTEDARPPEVTMKNMTNKIHDMMMEAPKVKVREILNHHT